MVINGDEGLGSAFTEVSIPSLLFEKIERRIRDTEFTSVSDYVAYVLREVLADELIEEGEVFTTDDEEKIRQRLRALGYLD